MSSWERSRNIPWSQIPHGHAENLQMDRERIFRQLQREADKQDRDSLEASRSGGSPAAATLQKEQDGGYFNSSYTFKWTELFKNAAFGGTIGAITGSVFGFMDGMRTAQQSDVLMNASNVAKTRYIMQGTSRSAALFGAFFGGFHILRYGIRVAADPGEWGEIGIAGAASLGALVSQPKLRPSLPYASMLIFMDCVHIVMRQFN